MTEVYRVDGSEARAFLRSLGVQDVTRVHTVRVAVDGGQVKFKVNEYCWTPGYGSREV